MHQRVRQQEWDGHHAHDRGGNDELNPQAHARPQTASPDLPDDVGDREWREEHQVVRAGEVLRDECRGSAEQRAPASCPRRLRVDGIEESAESVESERHPLRRQHLQMRALWHPVGGECEEHAGDKRGARVTRDLPDEQICAKPGQHERGEVQQVVTKDRVASEGPHRQNLDRLRDEVLRVGECQRQRVKDVGVEERCESREVTVQNRDELLAVPRQRPHHEDRIAKVGRHVAPETSNERPGRDHRQRQIGGRRVPRTPHQSAVASTRSS